jgi:hypothetical protein
VGGWLSGGHYGDLLRRERRLGAGAGTRHLKLQTTFDHIKNNWSCIVHELMEKIIVVKKKLI